ncbi:MAG: nucleotidyltransferase family protein [Bacteroidota bacterium]
MNKHLILDSASIKDAMLQLNSMGLEAINLFVIDNTNTLLGSVTDGDIRRTILRDVPVSAPVTEAMNTKFRFLPEGQYTTADLDEIRKKNIRLVPVANEQRQLIELIDLDKHVGFLPVDVVMMAGGEGKRLRPLTEKIPKPMLIIGDKPIIEHNIDRLAKHGVKNIYLSVNYLAHVLEDHFKDGSHKQINIQYIRETRPMGTIGSVKLAGAYEHEHLLVMNSDLLTNIDFADFYNTFIASGADMIVAATSYHVDIPYAVFEMKEGNEIQSLKEKPRYTYFSNAGIYLMKKELLSLIPDGVAFDTPDIMQLMLNQNMKLVTYPITGYWLDIGQHDDFKKAQEDIKHLSI